MKHRYLAAKLNINENIYGNNVEEMIKLVPGAIRDAKPMKVESWTWAFTDVKVNDDGLMYGKLSKYREERKESVDEATQTTTLYVIPNSSTSSHFIYDPLNEILIFEEISRIERDIFLAMFEMLVYRGNINLGNIDIRLVPREKEVYNRIKGIEVLTKIEFDLVPPNMIGKKELGDMKEVITDAKATRVKYVLENPKGINKDGPFIDSSIELVSNGYGDVKAFGFDNVPAKGKGRRHKTKKSPRNYNSRNSVFFKLVASTNPLNIIEEIKPLLQTVRDMLKKGSDDDDGVSS